MGLTLKGIIKFFSIRAFEGIVAILLITFMPNIPPYAKYTQPFSVTPSLPLEGKLAPNERLHQAELWHKGDFLGPEAFAEYNGELYTSLHGGDIVKLTGNHITPVVKFGKPCKGTYQEHICGRPLGLTFDKNGALYAADAYYGIFKVDVKTGKKLQLVSVDHEIAGKKPKLPNSIAVANNGDLYWTDSSTEFGLQDGLFDMFADGSGRLIHYDAKTKKNTVLIDGLHFANGLMLSDDESFLIVSESARSRIHRYYLKGPKKGTSDIFIDGLPGVPDNVNSDGQGGFLLPLIVARDAYHPAPFQILGPFPLARKFISRLLGLAELGFKVVDQVYPNEWAERGIHFVGHFTSMNILLPSRMTLLHVSKDGEILDSLHASDKSILGISEAFIFKDTLYLGSPFNDYIGRLPLAKIGLKHLAISKQPIQKPTVQEVPPTQQARPTTQAPPTPKQTTQAPPTPKQTTQAPPTPKQTTQAPPPSTTQPPPPPAAQTTSRPTTQTPKATAAPSTQPPPTVAPKQVPTTTAPPPKASPTPRQVPPTASPPKQASAPSPPPPTKQTPPKQAPPTTQTPPKQASTKKESPPKQPSPTTQSPPKQASPTTQSPPKESLPTTKSPEKQTPSSNKPQTKEQPKVAEGKESPKNAI